MKLTHNKTSNNQWSKQIILTFKACCLTCQLITKDLLISNFLFGIFNSPKKWKKNIRLYNSGTSSRIVSVHFKGELNTPKRHFEINWPLVLDVQLNFAPLLSTTLIRTTSLFRIHMHMVDELTKMNNSLSLWSNFSERCARKHQGSIKDSLAHWAYLEIRRKV